ncbi:hypothetical protein BCR33DRAFT_711645 [Rhizoclosmatium globosum]|uniref:Homeobox domain-containing protein n=1 Tax=Rhizoclosmatium globosum TaxID=329046 RepID=A0A1Y2D118_9FUNG|nr:hypothetical protein BCR33DRAFT_711645 [Rhizoclosmatium globosum]|eukprot:ORY52305.1 hypothetical protein BCR33DRAFT_711645 [Rhizoclosmatium globosum]
MTTSSTTHNEQFSAAKDHEVMPITPSSLEGVDQQQLPQSQISDLEATLAPITTNILYPALFPSSMPISLLQQSSQFWFGEVQRGFAEPQAPYFHPIQPTQPLFQSYPPLSMSHNTMYPFHHGLSVQQEASPNSTHVSPFSAQTFNSTIDTKSINSAINDVSEIGSAVSAKLDGSPITTSVGNRLGGSTSSKRRQNSVRQAEEDFHFENEETMDDGSGEDDDDVWSGDNYSRRRTAEDFSDGVNPRSLKRFRFPLDQMKVLKARYAINQVPTHEEMRVIATEFGVDFHKIKIWFQNRRAAQKRRDSGQT